MPRRISLRWLLLLVLTGVFAQGCQSGGKLSPFQNTQELGQKTVLENRLWASAVEFDQALAKSGQVFENPELELYLQQIMDRLFPEFKGATRVRVLDSSVRNAFALPNGSVYVTVGLLANLDSEAQLACILGHEGTHFVDRHSLRMRNNYDSNAVTAQVITLTGLPLVGPLLGATAVSGYSRDLEREADWGGYDRLRAAGYSTEEAGKAFNILADEAEAAGITEPFFFSSHPRMQERIESFGERVAGGNGVAGERGTEVYVQQTSELRELVLKKDIQLNRYASVIHGLREERRSRYPKRAVFYLGQAYGLRGEEGDDEKALEAYRQAISLEPDFAPSYRELGIAMLKKHSWQEAQSNLTRYLELEPRAADRPYIENYLQEIERQMTEERQ